MSVKTHRIFGIILLLLAVVIAVLSLPRTANLGLTNLAFLLLVLGAALVGRARKLEKEKP